MTRLALVPLLSREQSGFRPSKRSHSFHGNRPPIDLLSDIQTWQSIIHIWRFDTFLTSPMFSTWSSTTACHSIGNYRVTLLDLLSFVSIHSLGPTQMAVRGDFRTPLGWSWVRLHIYVGLWDVTVNRNLNFSENLSLSLVTIYAISAGVPRQLPASWGLLIHTGLQRWERRWNTYKTFQIGGLQCNGMLKMWRALLVAEIFQVSHSPWQQEQDYYGLTAYSFVGRAGSLADSSHLIRKVAGSDPALAATYTDLG